ncbi:MAG: ABC transporter permease [Candidatus Tokpelaia sp.]|uniref:cell division protein FtsX n=1 Tax=Candidatus Tokpelaia sp. TaxID=2233777 RepID=UPI00123C2307|nr:ABC transporter permease [Candidatus Tokpelaia sp.]KAA6205607.1 MAG: ABC transporter permease [Candidatus Tokpelaia sp.]KAA6206281.1 MAG: ABC transporter permease [Candidatus Tokpelaia sp.]KAA6406284.1 ABC transporter permease [Candidatus Tokpelaia sp.]
MIDKQEIRPPKSGSIEPKEESGAPPLSGPALPPAGPQAIAGRQAAIGHNSGALLPSSRPAGARGKTFPVRLPSLIPKEDMHDFALIIVIAIMSFLAAWTLFAAHFVNRSAAAWSAAIMREAVVQLMPVPGQDMEKALHETAAIARSFSGVAAAHIVSREETQALLAPWLGTKADIAALPVPRLVALQLDGQSRPDFDGLDEALRQNIKGVRFDRQQAWAARLVRGAHIMLGGALFLLILLLTAMILTVIFATRGALAGNMHIIEVLHFIGADDRFIARRFDAHFFRAGLKGACLGGTAACGLFALLFFGLETRRATPEGSQITALFGRLSPDWSALAEIFALILFIACITAAVSHCTVLRRLRLIDRKSSNFFSTGG